MASSTLRLVAEQIFTSTPVRALVLKPEVGATVTVYFPGGRSGITKIPSPPVVNCFSIPVASFFAVTVAPEMTPPFGSVTVPVIEPVVAWAIADGEKTKISAIRNNVDVTKDANGFAVGELLISVLLNVLGLESLELQKIDAFSCFGTFDHRSIAISLRT